MLWSSLNAARAAVVGILGIGITTLATIKHASDTTLYVLQGISVALVVALVIELWWLWPDDDDESRRARRYHNQRQRLKNQNIQLNDKLKQYEAQGATGRKDTPWRNPGRVKFLQIRTNAAVDMGTGFRAPAWYFAQRVGESGGVVVILPITRDNHVLLIEQYRSPVNARVLELPAGLAPRAPAGETEQQRILRLQQAAIDELEQETDHITPEFLDVACRRQPYKTELRELQRTPNTSRNEQRKRQLRDKLRKIPLKAQLARQWKGPVVEGPTSAGLTDEAFSLFVARDVIPVPGADTTRLGVAEEGEDIQLHKVPIDGLEDWIANRKKAFSGQYRGRPPLQVDPKVYFVKLSF